MGKRRDRVDITDVLIRYASGIDGRDWPLFRSCFTDDVHADYDTMGVIEGAEALTAAMAPAHDPMGPSFHRMTNFVIQVDGDTATARSYVHAVLLTDPSDPNKWVDVVGSYDDELVRTADGWRIAQRVSKTARMLTSGVEVPEDR